MSLFAVLFGARRVDATEHHEGLMLAIAFESLLKLLAFVAVGVFAMLQLRGHRFVLPAGLASSSSLFNTNAFETTLLAAAAIFCLPRQFQVGVVECASPSDLQQARWLLPTYLGLFSAFAVPIVALGAGLHCAAGRIRFADPAAANESWGTVADRAGVSGWPFGRHGHGRGRERSALNHDFE